MTIKPAQHIFVALDTSDLTHALDLAQMLKGRVGGVKIGKEFFEVRLFKIKLVSNVR